MARVKSREGIKFWEIGKRLSNRSKFSHWNMALWSKNWKTFTSQHCEQAYREGCFMVWYETEGTTGNCRNTILLAAYFLEAMSKEKLCNEILEFSLRSQQCFLLFLFCCGDNKMSYCGSVEDTLYGLCIGSLVSFPFFLKDCCNC